MRNVKLVVLSSWIITMMVYLIDSYVLSIYANTHSDSRYWYSVGWCGLVLTLICVSISTFYNKAIKQDRNTPLYIAFAMKMFACGIISILICIRSYFFHTNLMQIINILSQSFVIIYLVMISTGLISISIIEKNDEETIKSRKLILDDCNKAFIAVENYIVSDNIKLFKQVKDLFHKSIISINSEQHLTKLNNITHSISQINANSDKLEQNHILLNTIESINDFYKK